jgi:hypothetical protein
VGKENKMPKLTKEQREIVWKLWKTEKPKSKRSKKQIIDCANKILELVDECDIKNKKERN